LQKKVPKKALFFSGWYYMKCPGKLGRGGRAGWKKRFRGVRGFKEGQIWKRGGGVGGKEEREMGEKK
jgi:hypothetical protein